MLAKCCSHACEHALPQFPACVCVLIVYAVQRLPVVFVTAGKLIRNFVYRSNKRSNLVTIAISRELHNATSMQRNFYWTLMNLWPQQLPRHTLVVLSGKDALLPVPVSVPARARQRRSLCPMIIQVVLCAGACCACIPVPIIWQSSFCWSVARGVC